MREHHRQTAFGGHEQKMDCRLPLRLLVLRLGQRLEITPSLEKRSKLAAVGQMDRFVKQSVPTAVAHAVSASNRAACVPSGQTADTSLPSMLVDRATPENPLRSAGRE